MHNLQLSFFDGTQEFSIDKPIRLIELFAGIGAQAKALENIGVNFEHYRICEFDKYAVQSYNAIHGTNFLPSDITKLTADDLGIVDTDKYCYIMTYSFPCQDLSNAGKRRGMGKGTNTRSGLLWEVERLLDECPELPQVLLMENVPQVIGSKNISFFSEWLTKLESLGYYSKHFILNAKDYGIPQNRERCFMVSILGQDIFFEPPIPKKLTKRLSEFLDKEVDEKYYIDNARVETVIKRTYGSAAKITRGGGVLTSVKGEGLQRAAIHSDRELNVYGCYLGQTESFTRGGLKNLSRTLKSEQIDGGIIIEKSKSYSCR